jgi:glycosyltransferase involved in cell wall biosynthesis
MIQSNIYLSVIIPAYNEESRISKTLKIVSSYLKNQLFPYEIIVVGDGPTDNTPGIVKSLIPLIPNLSYIDRQENKGKGYTVREGMLKAQGRIRLFTDADNSTDISHFDKMRPFFDRGYEVVIGSRHPRDASGARQAVSQPWHKRILGIMGNLFIRKVAVPGIWDTQNGFKAFRDYAAQEIFSRTKINGWGFDIEVLALAHRLNYKIGIIPVNWINDPKSHVKFSGYFKTLLETVKIRRNLIKNKYKL